MPKNLSVSDLFEIYGALLPEKQRLLTELYYNDDLSLSEISENEGLTRQGVRDAVKRAEASLLFYESALGLYEKRSALMRLSKAAKEGDASALIEYIDSL